MRTLAVAQVALSRGIETEYVIEANPVAIRALHRRGLPVHQSLEPGDWLIRCSPDDLVIFDGYQFTQDDFSRASNRRLKVGVVDDLGRGTFNVDALLNQNDPDVSKYRTREDTTLLLGPKYALIRREFLPYRRIRAGEPRKLLITFGGADDDLATERAVELLEGSDAFEQVIVLMGPAAAVGRLSRVPSRFTVLRDPQPIELVFDQADAALSAAGSTTWELAYMGIPSALVVKAKNQEVVARIAASRRAALIVGRLEEMTLEVISRLADQRCRKSLSEKGMELVEGTGAELFLNALSGTS